jgi:hypothetical protein
MAKKTYKYKKGNRRTRVKRTRAGSRKNIADRVKINKQFVSLDTNYGVTNPYPVKNPHDD